MKRFLLAIMLCLPLAAFCAKTEKQTVIFTCDLHCQGCCDKVMKNIAFEKGVKDLVCNLKEKTVTVVYDAGKTDVPALIAAFEKIGKKVVVFTEAQEDKKGKNGKPAGK